MEHTRSMKYGDAVELCADDPLKPKLDKLEYYLDTAIDNVKN